MIICQRCFQRNEDNTSVCANCGQPLAPDWLSWSTNPSAHTTSQTPGPARAAHQRTDLVKPQPMTGGPRIRLRLDVGKIFELHGKTVYLIGRYDERNNLMPDVELTEVNGAAAGVSRQHAYLHVTPEGVFIEDVGSRNETVRNGARLVVGQRYPVKDGDRIELGSIGMTVMLG